MFPFGPVQVCNLARAEVSRTQMGARDFAEGKYYQRSAGLCCVPRSAGRMVSRGEPGPKPDGYHTRSSRGRVESRTGDAARDYSTPLNIGPGATTLGSGTQPECGLLGAKHRARKAGSQGRIPYTRIRLPSSGNIAVPAESRCTFNSAQWCRSSYLLGCT